MILEQEHIINKVFLEIETNSTTVAYDLKDRLGMFLKEDILPYLENYFKSIEQKLPSEIVQIPQLRLDIKATNHNDFKTLKTDTKEKLVQKIDAILKAPSKATEEVLLINTQEHHQRSLLFFIENGYTPWWKSTGDSLQFTHQEITEIAASSSFANQYKNLLHKPICKKRSIQQFTDPELQTILKATFKNSAQTKVLHDDIIKSFSSLSEIARDYMWSELITYLQSKNLTVFIETISSVVIKNTAIQDKDVYAFAKAVLAMIQQAFKISKPDTLTILQSDVKNTSETHISRVAHLIHTYNEIGLSGEASIVLQPVLQLQKSNTIKPKEIEENTANTNEKFPNDNVLTNLIKDNEQVMFKENITIQNEADKEASSEENDLKSQKETQSITDINADVDVDNKPKKASQQINKTEDNTIADSTHISGDKKRFDNHLQKEVSENKNEDDKEITSLPQKENKSESLTIDTYIKEITTQREELVFTNTGTYYVPNAGLIILHPYLKHFFRNCEITNDNNEIINKELAIHALHYLATKKEQQLESQMLFEKFLCGVPVKTPIRRHIQLSDTIKEQAEELLTSVIENWGVLHNASTDLLRHEFLQRQGKLSFKEDNPKIVIERKTQDILVDKLPWGIGICRFPWLDHMIFTNW
ncbi:hypothetical protein GCM10011344_25190 [Dokdonia pacifica]|uniref:Uncharacterized protein n=1 Tax=Dokdonia pacifica TaxID=1627892 RepID=A0A238WRF9_9FLAO|nr:contractile injection system tape measure protein [Dokdonia pacifica]GGG23408.1 hypothetical protein GCM10011344_25190 [Dokdonia pacifica]SNR48933.1 hypothetical protein SAMN06265376_1011374 [Dokdonia pacifica]